MTFKTVLAATAVAAVAFAATAASADTINFGQGSSGLTSGGVSYTVTDPGAGVSVLTQGSSWAGIFPTGGPVLFDNYVAGAVTFNFATAIASLTGVGIESNYYGGYTATLAAYDGLGNLIDSDVISFTSTYAPGTVPNWSVFGSGIVKVVVSSTNDGAGIGIGSSSLSGGVPEPAAWALMLVGFGAMGAMVRRQRKLAATAA